MSRPDIWLTPRACVAVRTRTYARNVYQTVSKRSNRFRLHGRAHTDGNVKTTQLAWC